MALPQPAPAGCRWLAADGIEIFEVTTPWRDEIGDYWRRSGRPSLTYAPAGGDGDLRFLAALDGLVSLGLPHLPFANEERWLSECRSLRRLTLLTPSTQPLDLSMLQGLEWLHVGGRTELKLPPALETLLIDTILTPDLHDLAGLNKLRRLVLIDAYRLRTLSGLEQLDTLETLQVGLGRGLTDVQALTGAPRLKELELHGCPKLAQISALANTRCLERLELASVRSLQTLRPLTDHPTLHTVLLTGTTNVHDGELSVLKSLPNLRWVDFDDRKHYDLTRSELDRWIAAQRAPRT